MKVSGKNVFNELDKNIIRKVYLSKNFKDKDIIEFIQKNKIKYVISDPKVMDGMIRNNQGIIVDINDYEYSNLESIDSDFVIILDHLEDPHNFGAIIRTCEAAGVDGIIIPKNRSVDVTSTVIRTSVGASKYVPIIQITNLNQTINELKKNGYWVVGTDMDGTPYDEIDYKGKTCIVIGSEGFGMSHLVKENCDFIATIPMHGKINSLNASVAAGIVIYEAVRIRK